MSQADPSAPRIPVSALSRVRARPFALRPAAAACAEIATTLDALAVRKLSLNGTIEAEGDRTWRLEARLGATVVQPCVVTLAPVTTRIDVPVLRRFVPREDFETPPGEEHEMPDDDTLEPLEPEIDLETVMIDALALALPDFPRSPGAELGEAIYAPAGIPPMTDAEAKPFAALADLKEKMRDPGGKD